MQIVYSQTHEQREQNSIITEYLDSLPKSKKFYLKLFPPMIKQFDRNYFFSFLLLILMHAQEISILLSYRQQIGQQHDDYTGYFTQYINYSLLINLVNQVGNDRQSQLGIFYFTLFINCFLLGIIVILLIIYAFKEFDIKKIKSLSILISFLICVYPFCIFLPALKSSLIVVNDVQFQGGYVYIGIFNIVLSSILGFLICIHDYEYSFKEKDKMAKRFSYYEVLKLFLQGMLAVILEFSNETTLTVYSCIYSVIKMIIYYLDQTYYNEVISCFYSMLTTFYCTTSIIFFISLISTQDLDFTIFILLSIPLSFKLGKVIYNYLQQSVFKQCLGKQDLSALSPNQLDIYIRLLNKNLNFFYEDYIDEGQGIIFENLYVNHQINCDSDDYRCFCHDYRRKDNKLEFDEYIGQDFRKKYVMFYIINVYEQYLKANSKIASVNSVTFAYISFLFEVMQISTKSFNMIYISQFKLVQDNSNMRDLFFQQILMYRVKNQFSHFFSNPSYQNQRLFVMAPIIFDQTMESMKILIKEQLINTGIFYDYLCSNFIDLNIINRYARILHLNLQDLKKSLLYLFDLNPDNLELQSYSMHYSNLLEFENSKVSEFKKKSKNLSRRMLQSQDRNIQVFSKNSCIVYASLIKKDGLIKKVSNSFGRIYGIENDLIIGKTLNSLIPRGLYNAHDDIISNFKNKGSMNIINKGKISENNLFDQLKQQYHTLKGFNKFKKLYGLIIFSQIILTDLTIKYKQYYNLLVFHNKEQRMVFGLNGQGFIIPLTIRLKLENMNDDFGVCSLLTSVNHDKEYLFISNEGQIMDITKKLYNLIFSSISSISKLLINQIKNNFYLSSFIFIMLIIDDLRRLDIKHLIPLIWGIQEVSEYDKTFYSILVVSKNSMFSKDTKVQDLKSNKKMQEVVDGIQIEDDIYSISFKVCIITTSIGLNFKFVEIENCKLEDNFYKKRIHIQNLKQCLNDILKNDVNFLIKEISEQKSIKEQNNQNHLLNLNVDQSQILNEDMDESFLIKMRSSQQNNPNKLASSTNLRDFSDEAYRNNMNQVSSKNKIRNQKNQVYFAGGNLIYSPSSQNHYIKSYNGDQFPEEERNQQNNTEDAQYYQNNDGTPNHVREKSYFSVKASPRVYLNQNNITDPVTSLPPTTDRMRIIENHPLLSELGAPSTNTNKGGQVHQPNNFSISTLQSPMSQTNLLNKQGQSSQQQQYFFPSNQAVLKPKLDQTINNPQQQMAKQAGFADQKQFFHPNSSDNSDSPNEELVKIVIKRHESRSKTENHVELPVNQTKNKDINKRDLLINKEEHQLLKEIEQDDIESSYLRVKSQEYNSSKIVHMTPTSPSNYNKYNFRNEVIKEVNENEQNNEATQNEMITSYRSLMQINQNHRQQKQIQINTILQHQNTTRSLNVYNQEMKQSLDKEEFKIDAIQHHQIENNLSKQNKKSSSSKKQQSDKNINKSIEDEEINTYEDQEMPDGFDLTPRKHKNIHLEIAQQAIQNNDQSSVHSSAKTSEQTRRKTIIRKIKTKFISKGIKAMIYIGIIAFFIFIAVSLAFYVQNYESFNQYISDFNKVTEASIIFMDMFSVVKIFSYIQITTGQPYEEQEQLYSKQRLSIYINQYKELLISIINDNSDQKYYGYLLNVPFNMTLFHIEQYINYPTINRNETQLQALNQFLFIIQQIKEVDFDASNISFLWYNMDEFKKSMLAMQGLIEQQATGQFDSIEFTQIMMLIIILIITSILIFTLLPLSVYNIIKCEEILHLFGCFHPEKLQRIVNIIEISVNKLEQIEVQQKIKIEQHNNKLKLDSCYMKDTKNKHNQHQSKKKHVTQELNKAIDINDKQKQSQVQKQTIKQPSKMGSDKNKHLPTNETYNQVSSQGGNINQVHNQLALPQLNRKSQGFNQDNIGRNKVIIKRQLQKRTRQIASFNKLARLDLKLFTFAFFVIVIMMIPPILNIVFTNKYMDEGKITLRERIIVLNTIVHLTQYQAANYNIWFESSVQDFSLVDKDSNLTYQLLKTLTEKSQSILTDLQSILENNTPRFDQFNYDDFYVRVLRDSICSAFQKYPDFFQTSLTLSNCYSLSNGIMNRGFVMAVKSFLDDFQNYFNIYTANFSDTYSVLQQLLDTQQIIDMNRSIVFMLDTFNNLDSFSSWTQNRYNTYINDVILQLFIFYIIVVILIFFSGWSHILIKFYKDFDSTKKLLSLFNMNVIIENAFLMQFLKNNDFGIK